MCAFWPAVGRLRWRLVPPEAGSQHRVLQAQERRLGCLGSPRHRSHPAKRNPRCTDERRRTGCPAGASFDGHRHFDQRPSKLCFCFDLEIGISLIRGRTRYVDMRDDLARLQPVFARDLATLRRRRHEEGRARCRRPVAVWISTMASSTDSATAAPEGCNGGALVVVKEGVVFVLAIEGKADLAAFCDRRSRRWKYQQRGRCSRLPPSVASPRICGVARWRRQPQTGQADRGSPPGARQVGPASPACRCAGSRAPWAPRPRYRPAASE